MNDLVKKLEALRIELDEATTPNAYRIGTVRTWKSGRFKKTATGWVPVSSMMKAVANKPKGAVKPQLVKRASDPRDQMPASDYYKKLDIKQWVKTAEKEKGATRDLKHAALGKTTSDTKTFIKTPGVVTFVPKGHKEKASGSGGMPHFGGTMPHRYENGECVYCGAKKPDNEAIEPENTTYGGFRRLAGLVDDRVLEAEEVSAVAKYADNPVAYNAQLAKLMGQLKRDKSTGVTGVRQGYKGTGSKAHKRQVWAKVPSHERGGPDIWLDSGFVKVGGIIDIPKTIPSTMKYGDESPEAVYKWISDTMKQLKVWQDAKYAQSPAVAPKAEEVELRRELEESGVANMSDEDVVKTARALASKAHKGKLSPKETKDFKMAMQRIKDEGLLGHDDEDDIWKWYGKGGQ
jgi:hypothetical protein